MTPKEIADFFRKNKFSILITGLLFALAALTLFYFIPVRYEAKGSLFITRKLDSLPQPRSDALFQESAFTYEGYYAQQNASSYTATLIGLIESDDVKKLVLRDLGLDITDASLRKLRSAVKVKKIAPQLVEVTAKGWRDADAEPTWHSLIENTIASSRNLSRLGDPNLVVVKVSDEPLVKETYRSLPLNIIVGFGFGTIFATLILSVKEYLKA
jgi:capsular polysaccharide biosynthesis protein